MTDHEYLRRIFDEPTEEYLSQWDPEIIAINEHHTTRARMAYYRPMVAVVLLDRHGRVFILKDEIWQLPVYPVDTFDYLRTAIIGVRRQFGLDAQRVSVVSPALLPADSLPSLHNGGYQVDEADFGGKFYSAVGLKLETATDSLGASDPATGRRFKSEWLSPEEAIERLVVPTTRLLLGASPWDRFEQVFRPAIRAAIDLEHSFKHLRRG